MDATRSLTALKAAAKERRYISYGDIAEINGVPRGLAFFFVFRHLLDVARLARDRKLPLITSIVVRQSNIKTGLLVQNSKKALARAARIQGKDLDANMTDEQVKQIQEQVFEWAQGLKE